MVRHQTCNLQVTCSSPGWTPLHSGLGQATYTCVLLSPSSTIWYQPTGEGRGVIYLAGKVTAGPVESNGSGSQPLIRIGLMNKFRSCYTKCAKMFLGFTKYYSVTNMLLLTGLPSFDTLMNNARKSDAARWSASSNALVKSLQVV